MSKRKKTRLLYTLRCKTCGVEIDRKQFTIPTHAAPKTNSLCQGSGEEAEVIGRRRVWRNRQRGPKIKRKPDLAAAVRRKKRLEFEE